VIAQAVEQMRMTCETTLRADVWGVFEGRVLAPILGQAQPVPYAQLVEQFGLRSPTQASNVLVTANRMFERLLRGVVGRYEKSATEIDDEIRDLWRILSATRKPEGDDV
jgi:hypothetical protein